MRQLRESSSGWPVLAFGAMVMVLFFGVMVLQPQATGQAAALDEGEIGAAAEISFEKTTFFLSSSHGRAYIFDELNGALLLSVEGKNSVQPELVGAVGQDLQVIGLNGEVIGFIVLGEGDLDGVVNFN